MAGYKMARKNSMWRLVQEMLLKRYKPGDLFMWKNVRDFYMEAYLKIRGYPIPYDPNMVITEGIKRTDFIMRMGSTYRDRMDESGPYRVNVPSRYYTIVPPEELEACVEAKANGTRSYEYSNQSCWLCGWPHPNAAKEPEAVV